MCPLSRHINVKTKTSNERVPLTSGGRVCVTLHCCPDTNENTSVSHSVAPGDMFLNYDAHTHTVCSLTQSHRHGPAAPNTRRRSERKEKKNNPVFLHCLRNLYSVNSNSLDSLGSRLTLLGREKQTLGRDEFMYH